MTEESVSAVQQTARTFVGVDVASRKLDVVYVDATGSPVRPRQTLANDPQGFAELLRSIEPLEGPVLLGCESTAAYHRPLLVALEGSGVAVVELNPLTIKQFTKLKLRGSRSDRTDSNDIAQYLRTFRPAPKALPERLRRELSMAVRTRRRLVEERTRLLNRLRRRLAELLPGFTRRFRGKTPLWLSTLLEAFPSPERLLAATEADLAELRTPRGGRVRLKHLQRLQELATMTLEPHWSRIVQQTVVQLTRAIRRCYEDVQELESLIQAHVREHAKDHVLLTIPGVGELTLAVLLAEAGDPHRFATVDKFIGYCGLYPGSKRSGDGGYSTRMVRKGNRMLRLQILLASTTARQFNAPVRAFYRRKVEQGKSSGTAGGAAGRKFAAQIYAVWRSGRPFEPEYERPPTS